jgi:YesN/AraC family two-component response regulator
LKQYTPDLILSDIRMPDMNGFDLLQHVKKLPATASTPIVFFSAIDDIDARKTAKQLGALDYIVKPFDEQEVSTVLAKYFPK